MNTISITLILLILFSSPCYFAQTKDILIYKSEDKWKEELVLTLDQKSNNFKIASIPKDSYGWTINRFIGTWTQNHDTIILIFTDVIASKGKEREMLEVLNQDKRSIKYLNNDKKLKLIKPTPLFRHKRFELKDDNN